MKSLLALLANPLVRAIAKPLIEELIAWIKGKRPRPRWLDRALEEVPELASPIAMADLQARAAKWRRSSG